MTDFLGYRAQARSANQKEYADHYDRMKWVSADAARSGEKTRHALLAELASEVLFGFKGTKLDCRELSAGCKCCGTGEWSCLFINGKCNSRCFYCPTAQDEIGVPTTNTIQFAKAADYADYVEKFRFSGVSISGGEPFLSYDTSLNYIRAVRKRMGDRLYIWLYTNGTLSNPKLLAGLRDAGVNEIRFDIGAVGYRLDKAKEAVGIIPVVTVEIPAIPEDEALLQEKVREMADIGISHLNLHQLRLTPFNFEKLNRRDYTFLHGEKVTILESELTALRLLRYCRQAGIALPINYCTFHYKHSFQRAAVRRKSATFVIKPHEDITENGHIRSLFLSGEASVLAAQAEAFARIPDSGGKWRTADGGQRLYFSASLIEAVSCPDARPHVAYFEPRILSGVSYRHAFAQVPLNKRKTVVVEKTAAGDAMAIEGAPFERLKQLISDPEVLLPVDETDPVWNRMVSFEIIRPGLQPYF